MPTHVISTTRTMNSIVTTTCGLTIDIGGIPILLRTDSANFIGLLEDRYGEFVASASGQRKNRQPIFELEVELVPPTGNITESEDVTVSFDSGRWVMKRSDFYAEWDQAQRRGWVRHSANPYSIDSVLRILHSLILARLGGFLVHAASAVRNGRAYLFAGVSGAGKTTISRLAPPDVMLLTDEISYVRQTVWPVACASEKQSFSDSHPSDVIASGQSYVAFGTPFAGELARIGKNLQAPVAALYLLMQGPENRIESVSEHEAARALLRNILFFAEDQELIQGVFNSVFDFTRRVAVRRLIFTPDERIWEMIH